MSRRVFFGLGGLPLVVAAVLAVTNAVAQSTPDPPQPLTSITVTITSVDRVAGGDAGSPPASLPDYYGRVFIGTTAEMSGTSTDQGNITPNWTFTRSSVPRYGGPVPIRIEIKDDDNPNTDPNADEAVDVDHFAPGCVIRDFWDFLFGCAEITVNVGGTPVPRPPSDFKGLDLNYNPATGWITGDVTGLGSVCDTGTQDQTAKVCISVSTGANQPIEVTRTDDVFRLDPVAGITCTVNDCALREALAIADDGDTIRFRSGGVYDLKAHPALSEIGHIVLSKKLTIEGPATGTPVVIRQTEPGVRVFEISGTGDVELKNLTITGGEAGDNSAVVAGHIHGGGIHNHGQMTLRNVTLTGNHATSSTNPSVGGGGAIYNAGGTTSTLLNVTIANNDAVIRGGGIAGPGTTRLTNTLLVGNTTGGQEGNCSTHTGDGVINSGGNMQFTGTSCGFGATRTPAASPIGPLAANGTYPLPSGSAAIDAGWTIPCLSEDQVGTTRPLDGDGDGASDCDVGAREYNPVGSNVQHQPIGPGGSRPVKLTFDDVTSAGATTLAVSGSGPARPAGYRQGSPPTYYTLATTAGYTGNVTVCIDYTGQSFVNESLLRVLHHTGGAWQNTALSLDTAANIACGRTSTLGVFAIFQVNQVPVASIAEPAGGYRLNEGGSVVLRGSGSDADGDPLTYEWSPATELNDRTLAEPTFSPRDDGTRTYTLVVRDGDATSAPASTTVRVDNVAPTLWLTGPAAGTLYRVGSPVQLSATFTDPGVDDVHTCKVDWDDGTPLQNANVTESNGSGGCAAMRTFTAAGVYTLQMTIDDGDGGTATRSTMVVVYDPSAGRVAGSGHIVSPAGAYRPNPAATDNVNFTLLAQYGAGSVPTGSVTAKLPTGAQFSSTSLQWLVVTGFKSQVQGIGRINGAGDYGFLLTAYDGQQPGGGGGDRLRLKLWNRAGGAIVYDNVLDPTATDDVDRAKPQAVGVGSSITIFKP